MYLHNMTILIHLMHLTQHASMYLHNMTILIHLMHLTQHADLTIMSMLGNICTSGKFGTNGRGGLTQLCVLRVNEHFKD